jgi:outer membrane murein-binding lipoprotein Lpp
MNQFSIDVSNLENKSDQLKQKRNAKLKKMGTDFKNGFKNLIDNF